MAGGIRMERIRQLINAIRKNDDQPTREELKSIMVYLASFVAILLIFSLVFATLGISVLDAIFEVGSALTTNGISMGATTINLPIGYKWLLIAAMIIGRVEILNILRAIKGSRR
jgi:trk system potassium uptake protein TrkH